MRIGKTTRRRKEEDEVSLVDQMSPTYVCMVITGVVWYGLVRYGVGYCGTSNLRYCWLL